MISFGFRKLEPQRETSIRARSTPPPTVMPNGSEQALTEHEPVDGLRDNESQQDRDRKQQPSCLPISRIWLPWLGIVLLVALHLLSYTTRLIAVI